MRNPVFTYAKTKALVFATQIEQSHPKVQASSHLLYSPVCVRSGRKPKRPKSYLTKQLISFKMTDYDCSIDTLSHRFLDTNGLQSVTSVSETENTFTKVEIIVIDFRI